MEVSQNPFAQIKSDLVVIIDGSQTLDEQTQLILENPMFVCETEIYHLHLEPVMLSSMLRAQRLLFDFAKKHRVLVIYLVDAWLFHDEGELEALSKWTKEQGICLVRSPGVINEKLHRYPCDAEGVFMVPTDMSTRTLLSLGFVAMSMWQQHDSRDKAASFITEQGPTFEKTVKDILDKYL